MFQVDSSFEKYFSATIIIGYSSESVNVNIDLSFLADIMVSLYKNKLVSLFTIQCLVVTS